MRAKQHLGFLRVVALLAGIGLPILAMADDGYVAPTTDDSFPWLGLALILVGFFAMCYFAFKNPHRSHLEDV
jgi:hypothetical protein